MFRLIRQISLRYFRSSWGRTSLVIGGIATGVSLVVAIDVINASVLENFRATLALIAGPADLEVTLGVGEIGFDESTIDAVRSDPEVRLAVPLIRGVVSIADSSSETLYLFGVDLTAEKELARYPITTSDRQDALTVIGDPRSVLVTSAFARRRGLGLGQVVKLLTPTGHQDLTVRGLLDPSGAATAFGGQLAIMDLPAAQLLLAKQNRVDQIDIVVADGAEIDAVRRRLQASLPATLTVARPTQRGEHYERILASFQAMLTGLSLLCLVAGTYIVYNTTSTAAAQRALLMASLRVTGAESGQLFRLLMSEAFVLGTAGAIAGIPAGLVLAWLLTAMVSESMGIIFQLRFPLEALHIELGEVVVVAIAGIGVTLFASFFAARRVARLEPLSALRADLRPVTRDGTSRRFILWWLVLVSISSGALFLEMQLQSIAWGNFGSTLWFASSIVIAVPLVAGSARLLSRVLARLSPAAGRVAAGSLFRSPIRTGVTVAAIALVLTVAITIASLVESLRSSSRRYYEEGGFLVGDLVVSAVSTEGGWLETPLPASIIAEIEQISGVRSVEVARALPGQIHAGERIMLLGLTDGLLNRSHYGQQWYREGDASRASDALRAGTGANVSIALADRLHLRVGDTISLDSATGSIALSVVGIVYDYMSDRGTVTINRRLLADRWHETAANRLSVFLEPGSGSDAVRESIATRLGERYRLKILSSDGMVDYHVRMIDRAFAFTDAIQLLIAIVTIAGIFDLLVSAIVERRHELALWRIVGADDRTVRHSVIIESAIVGLLGVILGTAVGLVTAWIWIRVNFRYLLGFYLDYHFAFSAYAGYIALVLGMTILAGYCASRYATRQSILEGVQVE